MRRTPARSGAVAGGLLLVLALLLSGCSATSGGSGSDAGSGGVAGSASDAAGAESAPGSAAAEPALAADRQVVTTASATVTADDPLAAAGEVARRVEAAGGRVEQRVEHAPPERDDGGGGERASAELVGRVPADALTAVVEGLADLGAVGEVSVSSQDVTATAVDLDARIAALQASAARLQELLADAATTADLVAAEQALSQRQGDLESLQSQRRLLAGQVELSTLTVRLVAGDPVSGEPAGGPDGFVDALGLGWRGLVGAGRGLAVAAGVVLPWALALAVVGALAAASVRGLRRLRGPQPGQ